MNLLQEFKNYLFSQEVKPSKVTVKNYLSDINNFIRWFEVSFNKTFSPTEVTKHVIDNYKLESSEKFSSSSVERHLSSLRKFFSFLMASNLTTIDPFKPLVQVEAFDPWHIKDFKSNLYVFNASHLTIKNYLIDIKQFLNWAEEVTGINKTSNSTSSNILNYINSDLVEEYKQRLISQGVFSPSTINRKLSSLRKYVMWLQTEGLLDKGSIVSSNIEDKIQAQINLPQAQEKVAPVEAVVPSAYSSFPPYRLFQKLTKGISLALDAALITHLVTLIEAAEQLAWKTKGQPIFSQAKKIRIPAFISHEDLLGIKNIKKEIYAPLEISIKNFPWYKKAWFTLKYQRPNWYRTYHSYAIVHYFHFAVLIIFVAGLAFGFYNGFVSQGSKNPTLAANVPTNPPRILSFQGRLTDNNDNPVTSGTNLRFAVYNSPTASGGALLWQEVDLVNPDTDGIFNAILGNVTSIPQSLFSENNALWLGVTVDVTPELTPRQQLATVAFASNSETLQGLLPITATSAGTTNVVLALNSSGNLVIGGSATPTFQATGGQFTLTGQGVVITTNAGTNSNVRIEPDGLGKIELNKPILNNTFNNNISTARGSVEVDDLFSILATSSGQSAFTLNQDSSGPLISASTSGNQRFTVDNTGNVFAAGDVLISGNDVQDSTGVSRINFSTNNITLGSTSTLANASGALTLNAQSTNLNLQADGAIDVNIAGGSSATGCTILNASGNLNCSGTVVGNGIALTQNYWAQNLGALFPINSTLDLLIGGGTSTSAKFRVTGDSKRAGTDSVASIAGRTSFAALVVDNQGSGDLIVASSSAFGTNPQRTQFQVTGTGALYTRAFYDLDNSNFYLDPAAAGLSINTAGSASISSSLKFANGAAAIQSTANSGLTIGGDTTGEITLSALNGQQRIRFAGYTTANCDLKADTNGFVTCGTDSTGTAVNWWNQLGGVLSPVDTGFDFALGGNSTASARFSYTGIKSGQGIASISGQLVLMPFNGYGGNATISAGLVLGAMANPTIQTTKNQGLTIGGNTTGQIIFSPNNTQTLVMSPNRLSLTGASTVDSTGVMSLNTVGNQTITTGTGLFTTGGVVQINGTSGTAINISNTGIATDISLQNSETIDNNVDNTVNLGFGAAGGILNLTSTTNSVINASARLDLQADGAIDVNIAGGSSATGCTISNTNGNLTCSGTIVGNGIALLQNYWAQNLGALFPTNSTLDFLFGSQATVSSRFRIVANNLGAGTLTVASISGRTSFATLVINNDGVGDLFTASSSGWTRFKVANSGALTSSAYTTGGGIIYTTSNGLFSQTTAGSSNECLKSTGGGTPTWGTCGSGGSGNSPFIELLGAIVPNNSTEDLLIGGQATTSAIFALINVNSGTPTLKIWDSTSHNNSLNLSATATETSITAQTGIINIGQGGGTLYVQTDIQNDSTNNLGAVQITDRLNVLPTTTSNVNSNAALIVNNPGTGDIFTASGAGTTRFLIQNGGNVGIGTTGPSSKLNVVQATNDTSILRLSNASDTNGFDFTRNSATGALSIQGNQTGFNNIILAPTSGNVGVGTTSPLSTLDVRGNSGITPVASFSGTTSFATLIANNDGVGDIFSASRSGGNKFVIANNGNVGVGQTIPLAKIDIKNVSRAAQGSEKITSSNDNGFTTDTGNWTTSGSPPWKINVASSGKAVKDAPGTGALTLNNAALDSAPAAGTMYKIEIDYTTTASSSGSVSVSFGGTSFGTFGSGSNEDTFVYGFVNTATNTNALSFTPTSNWYGTIDNVFIWPVTPTSIALRIESSNGTTTPIEIRPGQSGNSNIFVGQNAGVANITGSSNNAFGTGALKSNYDGSNNNAFGVNALSLNTTGWGNTAMGDYAISDNVVGILNTGVGYEALWNNTYGNYNSALGYIALSNNTSGYGNTGVGHGAIDTNTSGYYNNGLGYLSDVGLANLYNATAIGSFARVDQSSSLVLGSIAGINSATASARIGIGTTAPYVTFDVRGGSGTLAVGSFSGTTSFATLISNNDGVGDLFSASKSGRSIFTVRNNGQLTLGAPYYTAGCTALETNSSGTLVCGTDDGGTNWWNQLGGVLSPVDTGYDFALGGNSTSSAKFSFTGVKTGQTIASISGQLVIAPNNGYGGNIIPAIDNKQSIGASPSARWKDLFLGSNSLHIQCKTTDAGCPSSQGVDYSFNINSAGTLGVGANVGGVNPASLFVTQGGNVGIGTADPTGALHITRGNFPLIKLTKSGTFDRHIDIATDGSLRIARTGVADDLTIDNSGRVGIGVTTPIAALQVTGGTVHAGNAAFIVNQTGSSSNDIIAASASGTSQFILSNSGSIYTRSFNDLDNTSYFLDPAASGTGLNMGGDATILGTAGVGTTAPTSLYQLDVAGLPARFQQGIISGYTLTTGAGTYTNQWFPLATISISSQYQYGTADIQIAKQGAAGAVSDESALIHLQVKQQTAFGTDPYISLQAPYLYGIPQANIVFVLTSNAGPTTGTLYIKNPTSFESYTYTVLSASNNITISGTNTAPVASLPTGTQTTPTFGYYSYGGKMGIGNSAPNYDLQITNTAANPTLRIDPGSNTTYDPTLWLSDTVDTAGFKLWYDNSVGATYFDNLYNSANGDIFFRTQVSGTPVNAMTIDATGDVGIGTTGPAYPLDVNGITRATNFYTTAVAGNGIGFWSGAPSTYGIFMSNSASYQYGDVTDYYIANVMSSGTGRGFTWSYGTVPSMALNANSGNLEIKGVLTANGTGNNYFAGNVGIKETAPRATLDVNGTASIAGTMYVIGSTNGNANANSYTAFYDSLFRRTGYIGDAGTGDSMLRVYGDQDDLYLYTAAGSSVSLQNILYVEAGGQVGIGTAAPTYPLHISSQNAQSVTGYARQWYTATQLNTTASSGTYSSNFSAYFTGDININGSVVYTSDQRLKNLVAEVPSDFALDMVTKLNPVVYTWKPEANQGTLPKIGFFAQDVLPFIPEAVTQSPDILPDQYHLDYNSIMSFSIAAIKGLNQKVEATSSSYLKNLKITDTNLVISPDPNLPGNYQISDTNNNIINQMAQLTKLFVANINAGLINTQNIITDTLSVTSENVTINGQSLRNYIASVVQEILNNSAIQQFNNQGIISPIASIDEIHTSLISPLSDNSQIALKLDNNQLSIINNQSGTGSAVTSFDNQGNATFSGTLRAGKIIADQIEGLNIQTATISANYITNNYYNSTASAFPTLIATPSNISSTSGNFISIEPFASELAYVKDLSAATATFSQGLTVFGPSTLSDTSIIGQISVNGSFILADNSINVLGSDLNLQPLRQGGLSIMAGLFYIDTNGNATFGSDVTIRGTLYANTISPIDGNDLSIKLGTASGLLNIKGASDSSVLTINPLGDLIASGTATFSKLNLGGLVAPAFALSPTEMIATGSAGTGTINAGKTQMTINNKLVTDKSLIYITPTTNTIQTLFLLRQVPGESFTIGIQNPTLTPIQFNWIIVN